MSADSLDVEQLLRAAGAIKQGHFLLTSGLHSNLYLEKFQVLQYPQYTDLLCNAIAAHFKNEQVSVVAGPTMGGVLLAYATARGLGDNVRGIFAERANGDELAKMGERVFRRGFVINPGERVLIVDDILTTGLSLREILAAVERLEGQIVGIAVMVDRSMGRANFGYPLFSLTQMDIPTWRPDECPMCAEGTPLSKPGSS